MPEELPQQPQQIYQRPIQRPLPIQQPRVLRPFTRKMPRIAYPTFVQKNDDLNQRLSKNDDDEELQFNQNF